MSTEILSTLLQASGAAGVTAMFVFYLLKRDKKDQDMVKGFNQTINVHLKEANKSREKLAKELQEFSDTNRELKETLHAVYTWNKNIADENNKLRGASKAQGFS